jgi:zinc transport system permease protein
MEIFQYEFMQNAFAAGVLIAVLAPIIGVFVVLKRMSLIGDSLAHASLAGVALGMLFKFYPFYGALLFSAGAGIVIELIRSSFRKYAEISLAVVLSGGMGLAVVLISLNRSLNADLFSYLFGSIIAVTSQDLKIILVLGAVILISVYVLRHYLFAIIFDEEAARVSGIPVSNVNLYFTVLTAITVALSVRVVGTLLVSALIVIPTAISLQISRSFRATFVVAVIVAQVSVLAGMYASFVWDLAPGGTIVLTAVAILILVILWKGCLSCRNA